MGGRPRRSRNAGPEATPEREQGPPSSISGPAAEPWAEDVLRLWASEEAESRADRERRRRLLWGLGGLAAGVLVTAGGLAGLFVVDALRTPPAGEESRRWPPVGQVVDPGRAAQPAGSHDPRVLDPPVLDPRILDPPVLDPRTEANPALPSTSPAAGAGPAPSAPTRAEIVSAQDRVRRMKREATTRARRAFLAAKRAVARAWVRDLGPTAARLKAAETARSFAEAAEATATSRGPHGAETRDALKLAAYWQDVRDLIIAGSTR